MESTTCHAWLDAIACFLDFGDVVRREIEYRLYGKELADADAGWNARTLEGREVGAASS